MKIVHSEKRNCVYDKGIKKTLVILSIPNQVPYAKTFFFFLGFKGKSSSFKMGLVLDLVRQQHNETKTQDITHFQSHEMTMLSIHFCPLLCVCQGGGELSTQCWKNYFSRVTGYSYRGKNDFCFSILLRSSKNIKLNLQKTGRPSISSLIFAAVSSTIIMISSIKARSL